MREIGTLTSETEARAFADFLLSRKITSKVVEGRIGWVVWVHDEGKLSEAVAELESFRAQPDLPIYLEASQTAREIRRAAEQAEKAHRKASRNLRDRWEGPAWRKSPLTYALIAVSVVVAIATNFGDNKMSRVFHALVFSDYQLDVIRVGGQFMPAIVGHGWSDIASGQVWRLFTPILLHLSPVHLVFNMLFLRSLGGMIELRKGTGRFAILVFGSALVSNVGQYLVQSQGTSVAIFGGMSGVGYALFGYLWMKGQYHPEERLGVNSNTVMIMLAWLVLCTTGALGPIANTAHLVGLAVGVLVGITRF